MCCPLYGLGLRQIGGVHSGLVESPLAVLSVSGHHVNTFISKLFTVLWGLLFANRCGVSFLSLIPQGIPDPASNILVTTGNVVLLPISSSHVTPSAFVELPGVWLCHGSPRSYRLSALLFACWLSRRSPLLFGVDISSGHNRSFLPWRVFGVNERS